MAISANKGSVAATSGTQSVTGVGFRAKVVLLWLAKATADATWTADACFSFGMATEDGGVVQQACVAENDQDTLGTSDTAAGLSASTVLLGYTTSATPTQDYAATLVFQNDGFDIVWSDAPAAAYVVHYLCLAGTDISAARVGSFVATAAVATQDITVTAGFGQPNLVIDAIGQYGASSCAAVGFGFGIDDTQNACVGYDATDAATTMNLATYNAANLGVGWLFQSTPALDHVYALAAKSGWPTDGFRIAYSDQAAGTKTHIYCAIKGTFQAKVGVAATPTVDGNQDIDAGFTPAAGLVWSDSLPAHAAIDTTHADLGGIGLGAFDGTTQGMISFQQDDANTTSVAKNISDTAHIARLTGPGATPADRGVGTASFSGTNLRLAWVGISATARQIGYVILGSAASASADPFLLPKVYSTAVRTAANW